MSEKYFVHEYENNKDEKLVEITREKFDYMRENFDREQLYVNPENRLKYAQINDIQSVIDLFKNTSTVKCFHQDSERDIFIVS